MLTPYLEQLIIKGKAAYKTFVIGGTQKHILNVQKNRFIIITDLTYFSNLNFPQLPGPSGGLPFFADRDAFIKLYEKMNTQMKVFSNKSNNSFVFRNSFNAFPHNANSLNSDWWVFPTAAPTTLNTYLIHESDVSFTFSWFGDMATTFNGILKPDTIAFPPPFDYGQDGQTGAEPVRQIAEDTITGERVNFAGQKEAGVLFNNQANLEFVGPVNSSHYPPNLTKASRYPLCLVGYVEIKGNPTNIEQTS
jgi:hypothetical protein